jgi:hypothetical protein
MKYIIAGLNWLDVQKAVYVVDAVEKPLLQILFVI